MIAKDMTGKICGEKYGGVHGSSLDGVNWKLHYGELAFSRHITWDDGTSEELGNMDRPFILFEEGRPYACTLQCRTARTASTTRQGPEA